MADRVTFKLQAALLASRRLPRSFQSGQRSANGVDDDPFLPAGYLKVDQAFDLSPSARTADSPRANQDLQAGNGQVVALELPDGVTVITHPQNLHDTLARIDPDALDADGAIVFERALQTRGAAVRGGLGGAVTGGLSAIVSQVYTLTVGHAADPIIEAAKRKACEWLGEKSADKIEQYAELGVSWVGTKALMWAIESRLKREPGLYRWVGGQLAERFDAGDPTLKEQAAAGPLLVLIHGTGSSTNGSFDALQSASSAYWKGFEDRYGERILALEHRSLSESPVDNALELARALPEGATVHLVTHSRGGLVGDLLCLTNFEALIDGYALDAASLGEADPAERARITQELLKAHADQRSALHELAAELQRKKLRIERYVRVASPARGTRLASGNFDVFLSGLLSLMGWVPAFKGNPIYSAFKRIVIEVARNRTKPNLVPGIEAMLPGSPMARFLANATPQEGLKLAVISGDIEGGGWLKRLGVLFTDYSFFDGTDNDLVVDTDAMSAGIARPGNTRVLFDQGPEVSHFRYFVNDATRSALRSWLTEASVEQIAVFKPLRGVDERAAPLAARSRGATAAVQAQPVTVLLPGIMGSHLWLNRRDRVWFSIRSLALGGLVKLQFKPDAKRDAVEAEALFAQFYGDLHQHLASNQRVLAWPYDWRQPLDVLADRLALTLRKELDTTAAPLMPVRVLAHSMGGLVVRALIHKHPALWDELMARDGARFVMLGTPNQGSHLMVETLVGKADTVRKLGVLDQAHDLQEVIDIIGGFPGALQLLPKPGFIDTGNEQSADYFDAAVWGSFKKEMRDFWFGDGIGALPTTPVLEQAQWLWAQDGKARPALPSKHEAKVAYVFGCAAKTPCGIVHQGNTWKMLGTPHGDGSVTWDSGRIDGIGQFFYMPAEHGALPDTAEYFDAIGSLLERGAGGNLMTSQPAVRDAERAPKVAVYDAGPVPYPSDNELAGGLFGGNQRLRSRERPRDLLNVRVRAMDLRQVTQPILVGHYEQDAISGPESLIDKYLVHGELTVRHHLGLYAAAIGTASAVLLSSSAQERQRGSLRGAVVAGLGKYDGSLTVGKLTEAVRTAGLRYLVHLLDSGAVASGTERGSGIKLASLLLGYNSSANLSIADSVQALLRGVIDANRHFAQTTHSKLRITQFDIVEIYLDTAITATYAAKTLGAAIDADPRIPCRVTVDPLLHQGEGMRQRLFDGRGGSYWPRLLITDAERSEGESPPESRPAGTPGAPAPRTTLAQRLRYLYLGQRARAESVVQQRQPGLVERLVERQMTVMRYDPDFSRTLFQLLVPHDFKDAARQMQQMVFVLDSTTANLPWELMLADDTPLAVRTAMVRQLASTQFRNRVSQTMERRAYVVGNPSTDALDDLPAAEKEALTVTEGLARHGFEVDRAIGRGQRAIDVINGLYKHPYRIVHIAGHGMFDDSDGDAARSGVVLSDGLLITAAEIEAMEIVPDLVFLNCCHLGKIERAPVAFNKLAYSIARELIGIGVRAVVVAGWAVEDAPASLFAETFYECLLADNLSFGEAVYRARRATWDRHPTSITWGAYQAYGDPGWRADPRTEQAAPQGKTTSSGVTPEELLDKLEGERVELQRSGEILSPTEAARVVARMRQWFDAAPPEWVHRPDLMSALGDVYSDLGEDYLELACECYRRAVRASDRIGRVPIKAIEHLASSEARLGESRNDAKMVARAVTRLTDLLRLSDDPTSPKGIPTPEANPERAGQLGSVWKRKAAVHARAYLADSGTIPDLAAMSDALQNSTDCYHAMASQPGATELRPYQTLNWLFLWSIRAELAERASYVPHVQRCAAAANAEFSEDPMAFNSTMVAEASLIIALLDDSLAAPGALGEPVLARIALAYEDALQSALVTPKERDLVLQQIQFMALFHQAYEKAVGKAGPTSVGARLALLSERLRA